MQKQKRTNDLGQDPIPQLLFRLAAPAIAAQVVNMLYNVVDRMYIGHIPTVGTDALTGVGVTMPILMLISAFSGLIGMGGAPRASIKMGQQDHKGAEKILGSCFAALLVISLLLTGVFLVFGRDLLLLFGASENTIGYAQQYLNIYVCGTVFVQLAMGMNPFISTQGYATTSMMTVLIGAVINIVLDPILIFGFDMGVQGAALATILSQAVSAVWVMRFLFSHKSKLRLRRENIGLSPKIILPVLALGVSPFIMQSTESLLSIVFNTSLRRYGGDIAVGTMTIMASIMQLFMLPVMGLSQGAQPIIGYNFGARNSARVKKAFKLLMVTTMTFVAVFWLAIMLIPQVFVALFTPDPALTQYAVWAVRIYLFGALAMGAQMTCQQTFIAVGQAKSSIILALLRKIILLIPLIYLLPLFFQNKVLGVFVAEPVADILATTVTVLMFAAQFGKILKANEQAPTASPTEA
ncbi:MAG: MATE family efflux transporter [Angelakisella sp.]